MAKGRRNTKSKNTSSPGPLPSPEPTPGVEDGRVAAELRRKPAKAVTSREEPQDPQKEIERIMRCSDDAYAEILAIDPGAGEEDKEAAWIKLGCMLHSKRCQLDNAENAFKKLRNAAEAMDVDQRFISQVELWDGTEDLQASDDSDTEEKLDSDTKMEEDPVPMPPPRVMEIYREATPFLHKLGEDPANSEFLKKLSNLNDQIIEGNTADNAKAEKESDFISDDQWVIPMTFFGPHYKAVLCEYAILKDDPANQTARKNVSIEKSLIDEFIEKNHFPREWGAMNANDYVKQNAGNTLEEADNTLEKNAGQSLEATSKHMEYPWITGEAVDGSIIVGVRNQGKWGTQVCIETIEENGRVIRRHESASEVGLPEVEKYKAMRDHKNLADGQSKWSSKDRSDFDELLWVTKSQVLRKNVAANRKDPPADCCVRFHNQGINILTVSSLNKVLGEASARARIEKVCRRDGIPPPWEAGYVSQYYDPARVEKDSKRRRAKRDAQAKAFSVDRSTRGRRRSPSAHSNSSVSEVEEARDSRVELEAQVAELTKTVDRLAEMFAKFMNASAPTPLAPST